MTVLNSSTNNVVRRSSIVSTPVARPMEDRPQARSQEPTRTTNDKIAALRNYRRAKGLCFTCGERYSRDHKFQPTVQLHVVQEMVDFFQQSDGPYLEYGDTATYMELMQLADVSMTETPPE